MVVEKLKSMSEAIKKFVHEGDTVYVAGFTHLIPHSAGHEIIRQRIRNITLCRPTPDIVYDQMIAAGCAKKVVFSWAGNRGVGSLRARAAARTSVRIGLASTHSIRRRFS